MSLYSVRFMFDRKFHSKWSILILGILMGILLVKFDLWMSNYGNRLTRHILSREQEFLFVGGVPRSGTTLMRVLLDIHPEIRCGEETVVIPEILDWFANFEMSYLPALYESGVTPELMDDAMSAFLSEVIQKHDREEKVLCSKDPTVLMYMERIHRMFPKAKFLLLIRDARATVKSINDLNLWRWGFERNNFTQNFIIWNGMIASMANQCANLGSLCLMVHYERLVLDTKSEIQRILNFLQVPFYEKILEHEKYMNRSGDKVQISQSMLSLDQVTHKIYKKKLHSWVDFYPNNVLKQLDKIAPMLKTLGYDTNSTIPSYENLPIICRDKQTLYNGVEESCEAVKF